MANQILWHSLWILASHPSLGEVVIFPDDIDSRVPSLDIEDDDDFKDAVARHLDVDASELTIDWGAGWAVRRWISLETLGPGRRFRTLPRWSRLVNHREEVETLEAP